MLILRNLRILTNFNNLTITNVPTRYLRGLPQRRVEFSVLPSVTNGKEEEKDEVKLAQKELAELTGGLSMQQLKEILEPHKNKPLKRQKDSTEAQLTTEVSKQPLLPTYNLAAYVDKSELLQQFIQLGVDLNAIERRKGLPEFVLKLNLEQDVKPRLLFLKDQGVPAESFGDLITKNPLIFKVDLDDLQTRVNYMEAKRFSAIQIQRILTLNPFWLMFSTKRIDKRLGYFQKEFSLRGDDVRFLASKLPRLITYNMEHIRQATFSIREEMGFDKEEIKCLLLSKPRLWLLKPDDLIERFAYVHQEMQLSHQMILQQPEILTSREFRLRERHEFLKMLGRAQYDPEKDMYISPKSLVEGNNHYFVRKVAKSDMETILTKFNNLTITNVPTRYLRGLSQRSLEFSVLPSVTSGEEEKDEVKLAQKELAELTGGLSMQQIKEILEPHKNKPLKRQKDSTEAQLTTEVSKQPLLPTYNLATYVDKSELLQQSLVEGNNHYFQREVAKSDMETFELFLKTR
ncbi:hypothetical protein FF38_10363 [Lucilia cuprina]|uniref:Transcription termination factor 3, mitochondrial n=1 Tax=Lucilia cuprina TaxID=7375 RepID=A0A0L0C0C5_LUCCU|nr:hypothetical protein FF38_10363 [Lucilia cuprina]